MMICPIEVGSFKTFGLTVVESSASAAFAKLSEARGEVGAKFQSVEKCSLQSPEVYESEAFLDSF